MICFRATAKNSLSTSFKVYKLKTINIAIFVSGGGTNCENLIRHFSGSTTVHVALVVSSRADALALERAQRQGVPTAVITKSQLSDPTQVMPLLRSYGVSFIVLAGFLPLVPDYLIDAFPRRIINLHPALLPKYGGKGMYGHHIHEAVKAAGEKETGITIHYVNNELDAGEHIAQFKVALSDEDTADTIAAKIHELEQAHFPEVIESVIKA